MTDKNEDESMIARALDIETTEWLTPHEAAEIMGVSIRTVQNLCTQNKPDFHCKKWGRSWMVDKKAALAYVKTIGRPRKTRE